MSPNVLKLLILGLSAQAALVLMQVSAGHPASGIDFYHYWAVQEAHAWPGLKSANPYRHKGEYEKALNAYAAASSDPRLKNTNRLRQTIAPSGTPLFYAAFSALPTDYSLAFAL